MLSTFKKSLLSSTKKISFSSDETLTYICVALIVVYFAIAKPYNTPTFFTNPFVKAIVMLFVVYVASQNLVLGLAFGLSMALTICYSHINTVDGFIDFKTNKLADMIEKASNSLTVKEEEEPKDIVVESFRNF